MFRSAFYLGLSYDNDVIYCDIRDVEVNLSVE